jgi:hypothetical protein
MQSLNAYFVCLFWSSRDWMATIYAPLIGVSRTEWLMYMRLLELQGLHGYCVCILWNSQNLIIICMRPLELWGAWCLKKMHQKPFCASTHGAQTLVRLCIHIWFNIHIVVKCPCGSDDVSVFVIDTVEYFFIKVYFDMSQDLLKNIHLTWIEYIWNIFSYTCSHVHALIHRLTKKIPSLDKTF